jgi:hypothetical protein
VSVVVAASAVDSGATVTGLADALDEGRTRLPAVGGRPALVARAALAVTLRPVVCNAHERKR